MHHVNNSSKQPESRMSTSKNSARATPNTLMRQSSLTGASSPEVQSLPPIAGSTNFPNKAANARSPRKVPDSGRLRQSTSTTPRLQSQNSDNLPDAPTRRTSRQSTGLLSKINNWRRDSSIGEPTPGTTTTNNPVPDTAKQRKRSYSFKASKASVSSVTSCTNIADSRLWAQSWHENGSFVDPTPSTPSGRPAFSLSQLSAGIASSRRKMPLWHVARDIVKREFKPKHFSALPDADHFDVTELMRCFPALLTNEIGLTCFVRFCGENFALENMLFYEAATCVLDNPLPESFHAIQSQYLDERSEHNVNISGELRRAISEQINRMDMLGGLVGKELLLRLDDAQAEIFLVMERDLFHRFLSNPQCSEAWRLECRSAMDNLAKHMPNEPPPPPPPKNTKGAIPDLGKNGSRSLEYSETNNDSSESESEQAPAEALLLGRRAGVYGGTERSARTTTIPDLSGCIPVFETPDRYTEDHLTLAAVRASKAWEKCDLSNLVKKTTLPDTAPATNRPLSERSMSARLAKRSSEALIESRLFGRQPACLSLEVGLEAADLESARSDRRRSSSMSYSRRSFSARDAPRNRLSTRVTLDDFDALTMQRNGRSTEVEVASATAEAGAVTDERVCVREESVLKCNDHLRMLVLRRSLREIQMAPLDDLKAILRENEHLAPAVNLLKAAAATELDDDLLQTPANGGNAPNHKSVASSTGKFERPGSNENLLCEPHSMTAESTSDNRDSCTMTVSSESEEGENTHRESLAKAIQRARLNKANNNNSMNCGQAPKAEPNATGEDDGYGAVLGRLQRALLDQEKRKSNLVNNLEDDD